jgi:hypothetical protein
MKLQLLMLSMVLASNVAFAKQPDRAPADQLVPFSSELKGLSKEDVHQEDQVVMAQDDEVVNIKEPVREEKEKSLDELDTEAAILAKKAEKLEKEAAELRKKSEKLAQKSEKHDKKSDKLADKSEKAQKDSEAKLEDSEDKLADSKEILEKIESSPDLKNRDLALRQVCEKQNPFRKFIKMPRITKEEKEDHEARIENCVQKYRVAKLKKKDKIKKKYVGSQCSINLGISIECPEGTYKFIGNDTLAQISDDDRNEIKDVEEKKVDSETVASASAQ